jgi:hypothetical protein
MRTDCYTAHPLPPISSIFLFANLSLIFLLNHFRRWLYTFASENNPNDSQKFIKALFATRQDYGQRILAQRQSLFDSWQQSFVPGSVAEIIESQNLEHLRDHLFSTVNLSDDCLALDDPDECIPPEDEPALQLRKEEDETVA